MKALTGRRGASMLLLALPVLLASCAPKDAPVQSNKAPFGFPPFSTVKASGSDLRSWWFQRHALPSLITLADQEYSHNAVVDHFDRLALDPAKLTLAEACNVRVYFVGEGSGYVDALGVNLDGIGIKEGHPQILFPNANCPMPLDQCAANVRSHHGRFDRSKLGPRTQDTPLHPGDFIDLGTLPAGAALNFFLIANDEHTFTPVKERNPDNLAHMVAMAVPDTPYMLLSFEDMLGGGDADYEDCVFAVRMSGTNIQSLMGTLDPMRQAKRLVIAGVAAAILIGVPGTILIARRRARKRRLARAYQHAEELMESSRPEEAIGLVQDLELHARDRKSRDLWARLEVKAREQMADIEGLREAYLRNPDIFAERESASLAVGRAQVEEMQFDAFAELRNVWRDREQTPAAWQLLDADMLWKQHKDLDAIEVLAETRFQGPEEGGRRARLAVLKAHEDPNEAAALLARAVELGPKNPDVHLYRAMLLESRGQRQEAIAAYRMALACAPRNLFFADHLAEAYRRGGDIINALNLWRDGLRPPSMGFIWTKLLFWTRVFSPIPLDIKTLALPPGPLRPLIEFMLRLDPGRFWDAKGFAPIAERQPELLSRQEVFWLRVLESLRTGSEGEALSLLNLQGFGARSWQPQLDAALLRIVIYRHRGFLGTPVIEGDAFQPVLPVTHPFFDEMDRWMQQRAIQLSEDAREFLKSDRVFAAACFAVGWTEAGLRLLPNAEIPASLPVWLQDDIAEAFRSTAQDPSQGLA